MLLISKRFDEEKEKAYKKFISLESIFKLKFTGFTTHRDHFAIAKSKDQMLDRVNDIRLSKLSPIDIKKNMNLKKVQNLKFLNLELLFLMMKTGNLNW